MDIRFVSRDEIEKIKWDSCVHYANNGNVFGYTWYLDNVAREWDGLVEGDYVSVFPLIKKEKRGGIPSLYTPDLIPKSGIYSIHILSSNRVNAFLEKIPEEYLIKDMSFTRKITLPGNENIIIEEDYELNLRDNYEAIYNNYTQELKDGLKIAERDMKLTADSSIKPEEVADFYFKYHPKATEINKHAYLRIMYNLMHRGTGFISGIKDENGQLIAVDSFAYSHGKIISLVPTHSGGNAKFALWSLTDLLLQSQSGKPTVFDFNINMGDINPSIFNAKKINYTSIKENTVKGWKKWLY